jgi:hypothetical protein
MITIDEQIINAETLGLDTLPDGLYTFTIKVTTGEEVEEQSYSLFLTCKTVQCVDQLIASIDFSKCSCKGEKDKIERKSKRTTSQFVFAMGMNNVITEGESLSDSDFRFWRSKFYEWGLTYNTRILKNNNVLHAKYGLSLMYNNLRPTDNRYFVRNGNQTDLQTGAVHFDDSRFRNVFLVAPMHLEFDFTPKKTSKDGTKTYFHSHESLRLGIGGYAGVRIKSKQILKYEVDGLDIKERQRGDFNVNDFTYGLSAYIGYKATSLYVKYDLNPMFQNNAVDQNNISLGIRFDFN